MLATFVTELPHFIKVLNSTGVHGVGHSMGGWIALQVTIHPTERMKTYAVVNSGGLHSLGRAAQMWEWHLLATGQGSHGTCERS